VTENFVFIILGIKLLLQLVKKVQMSTTMITVSRKAQMLATFLLGSYMTM
jgi:hypothetical protein